VVHKQEPLPNGRGFAFVAGPMPFLEGWFLGLVGWRPDSPGFFLRGEGEPEIQLRDSAGLSPASHLTPAPRQRGARCRRVVETHVLSIQLSS
jgi:hypothetical protein